MKELKVLLLFIFVAVVGIGAGVKGVHFLKPPADKQQVLPASDMRKAPTPVKTTTQQVAVDYPYNLSIPKINVTAHVESVGMDNKGAMGVPNNADNVAWYNLGYKVGEKGSAVMAGHLDKVDGSPAVFWDLTKLVAGDKMIVTDIQGKEFTYKVVRIEKYPYASFPIKEVFGPSDKSMLNLITCEGTFDKKASNYSHRTVVYSELVQ